jgi:ATP-dependent DNA helicase RecQ
MSSIQEVAQRYLRVALGDSEADFRDGQWESISQILDQKRVLVVQRTGWGKSMIYFLATRLLRDQGQGPTLLISPLLSLMRNQIEAAERIGVIARTINSTNPDDWNSVESEIRNNNIDVLLISPERLANVNFRQNVLATLAHNIGLLVVDEAHCISDWGHDFRPDYKRIVRIIQAIPPNIPVLATTATANNRVVKDIRSQLGDKIELSRGTLVRKSLKLQNINMPSPSARMAWLAATIPSLPSSGIVYALTQRDTERVAEWLQINEINAKAYHADLRNNEDGSSVKEELEQQLLNNEIKVLVATVALGMGFDKPDLGFVIHFQRPASVVHYYQQVGRAGRAVSEAYGILLCGEEDDIIADYFIRNAFPPQQHVSDILRVLDDSEIGLSVPELQSVLNLKKSHIDKALKFLTVESPSPIIKQGTKWQVTAVAIDYRIDQEYIDAITQIRRNEQIQMQVYMNESSCLMSFLQLALDDPHPDNCGKCKNCNPIELLDEEYDMDLANRASLYLRRSYQPVPARKMWPANHALPIYGFSGRILPTLLASEGRALCLWRDAGWGQLVAEGKYRDNNFSDELVTACVELLDAWSPTPPPTWVTCIPSLNHPDLVPNFAQRLATATGIPFYPAITKILMNRPQKEMENSFQQARNLDGAFSIKLHNAIQSGPCIVIDDMVDSRWTFTVATALLREAGCVAVHPLALALNSPRMD